MIKVLSMNPSGIDGIRTIMTFEFTFDNPNELPKSGVYTMNQVIYLIANNSIAINNKDNFVYKFNVKQWIKTVDKITPNNINNITSNGNYILSSSPTSTNTNVSVNVDSAPNIGDLSVTENGVYNASDEGLDGFGNVNVSVSGGANFTKLITNYGAVQNVYGTPKAVATNVVYLHSNSTTYNIDLNVTGQSACYVLIDPAHEIRLTNVIEGTSKPQITFKPAYNTGSGNQTYFYINGNGPSYYDPDRGNMPQYAYTTSFSWDSTPSGYTPVHRTYRWSSGDIIFNMT